MDDCPASHKSVSENVGALCESSKETPDCAFGNTGGLSINDFGHHIPNHLNNQDAEDSNDKCNTETVKEDVSKDSNGSDPGNVASVKCLIKCATFPCSGMSVPTAESPDDATAEVMTRGADAKSPDFPYSRSISLPTPLKLVSAIKGGREKQGCLPRKLTVTWAPDVYDPIPTSVSHVPNKGQSHKSGKKKNGKNKQKNNGKSSRGTKGRDKKQARKHGGSSQRSYHPLDDSNMAAASSSEVQSSIVDFDIGSPDPFCGSSFLKKSVTKLHFPVAEAS